MNGSEESDETDLLLSIPPDYFNVYTPESEKKSDSDENFDESVYVLNDLLTAKIRNTYGSKNLSHLVNLNVNTNFEEFKTNEKQCNTNLNANNCASIYVRSGAAQENQQPGVTSLHKVPIGRHPFSLPSSPSDTIKSYFNRPTSNATVKTRTCDAQQNSAANINDDSVGNSNTNSTTPVKDDSSHTLEDHETDIKTTDNNRNNELLKAIDEYLIEVNKDDKKSIQSVGMNVKSEETNHIMNRFLKDDMDRINSLDLDRKSEAGDSVNFDLRLVDSLLKEMETTQSEIEKKLKSREKNEHVENDPCTKKLTWQSGDFIGSIPDLGFGVRELYASPEPRKTETDKLKKPVTEQPCVQKMFTPLGDSAAIAVSHSNDTKAVTVPEEQSNNVFSARRRLNLDGYKLGEYSGLSDSKQLSMSNSFFDSERRKDVGAKVSSPRLFRRTSTVGLINKGLLSPKLHQTKQFSSPKTSSADQHQVLHQTRQFSSPKTLSADQHQEFDNRKNKGTEGGHLSERSAEPPGLPKSDKNHPSENLNSNGLLSLSDLWTKDNVINTEDPSKLKQKLEEERYRRQHCEQLIHNLQYRLLEQQEKLAVAMHVDQEKDRAIQQIRDAWHQLTRHWTELEDQRHKLAQELQKEKDVSKQRELEISKKVEQWNTEIAQALDLAAGYKEKSEAMNLEREALKQEMDKKMQEMREKLTSIEEENKKYVTEKTKLVEELEETRREAAEEKRLVQEAQKELQKTKEHVADLEAELTVLQDQKQALTTKLKEERTHIAMLEQQTATMQQALTNSKHNEKTAADEVRMYGERLEVARSELRTFYQSQLETVVKEKLKEFQDQLDSAEVALKAELETKEKQWSEKAVNQCRLLADRHKEEINKMDEQFRNEMKAMKAKLAESEQKRITAENLLKEETNRRTEIAERLHSVMEKQWKETLKIITNASSGENNKNAPSSNKISEHTRKKIDTFLDMARNMSSHGSSSSSVTFYEDDVLPVTKVNSEHARKKDMHTHVNLRGITSPRSSTVSSTRNSEDIPFGKEGLTTCRPANTEQDIMKQADQEQLKHYIQMLLERTPGNPVGNESGNRFAENYYAKTDSQNSKWEALMMQDGQKVMFNDNKAARSKKRPWK